MNEILNNMRKHNENLSMYATNDSEAIRLSDIDEDFRPPYFRDADKILYSLAYFRYIDKTQVFSLEDNDMISKRMTHVQLVSKIARTIGRGLNLNEDLIEAASLGHDLGHVPFGHVGEKILNNISVKNGEGNFYHNVQSVRILMNLENYGKGNNITVQVLDAILCHNGEKLQQKYEYKTKTKEEFLNDYKNCYRNPEIVNNLLPMTLEGCIVRVSDIIAYVGRDVEDAVRIGKMDINKIPNKIASVLGKTNSQIVNTIVVDIIKNSLNKNHITMSKNVYTALQDLIDFNYKNVYYLANTKERISNIENMFESLFKLYYKQILDKDNDKDIYTVFLNSMSNDYIKNTTPARKVIDFISGMTDNFFIKQYNKNFNKNSI